MYQLFTIMYINCLILAESVEQIIYSILELKKVNWKSCEDMSLSLELNHFLNFKRIAFNPRYDQDPGQKTAGTRKLGHKAGFFPIFPFFY